MKIYSYINHNPDTDDYLTSKIVWTRRPDTIKSKNYLQKFLWSSYMMVKIWANTYISAKNNKFKMEKIENEIKINKILQTVSILTRIRRKRKSNLARLTVLSHIMHRISLWKNDKNNISTVIK